MIQHWPNGAGVYFDPRGCVLPTADVVSVLEYHLWLIRERTGINLYYAGETSQHHIDGAIVIKFAGWEEFKEYEGYDNFEVFFNTRGIAARTHWPNQPYLYSRILINSTRVSTSRGLDRRLEYTLSHELWHNTGIEHLETPYALMTKKLRSLSPINVSPTCADFVPIARSGDQRFVELLHNYDIFIPKVYDKMAGFEYVGDRVNDHKWRLRFLFDCGPDAIDSALEPVDLENPNLRITDIRTPGKTFGRFDLDYDHATELWTLVYAE